uniref:Uncharacterized protein n=1 Tax=Arion vulgaris TaxID=1028688 RepID=A0A0B7B4M6_9EUPU
MGYECGSSLHHGNVLASSKGSCGYGKHHFSKCCNIHSTGVWIRGVTRQQRQLALSAWSASRIT